MIDLDFEGWLIMEQSTRPNRPVYLIEGGKKRGITSPQVLQRFGGWGKVYEVPLEVIQGHPDGDPVSWEKAGCVSKRGVDDGNQKGGGLLQPAQEGHLYYST